MLRPFPDAVVLAREALRDPVDRVGNLGAQELRLRRVANAVAVEREDLERGERAQDPPQRVDRQTALGSELRDRLVAVRDQIGDPRACDGADRLRDHEAVRVGEDLGARVAHGSSTSFPNLPGLSNAA